MSTTPPPTATAAAAATAATKASALRIARIEKMQTRLKQLKAAELRAQKRITHAEATKHRKQETRRKILIGAAVLQHMHDADAALTKSALLALLSRTLTRDDDRALFGLAPTADHAT